VTFRINARTHELAIYAADIEPEDINTSLTKPPVAGCPDVPLIDDPNGRIAVFDQPCTLGLQTDVVSFIFDEPGRYLFICTFFPPLCGLRHVRLGHCRTRGVGDTLALWEP
jgi:hypothetical protein